MRRISADEFSTRKHAAQRQAFTLVELMIVVVVIAVLMGLLLPAVMGAFRRARIMEVVTEIRGLEAAIAQFKSVYGVEPPSRFRLYENATGAISWQSHSGTFTDPVTGATLSHDAERTRSIAIINRIWPNFNFSANLGDLDGTSATYISLTGAECLVFFLGGRPVSGGTGVYALTGFSKNPANPFLAASGTESREGPFYEFKPSRLKPSLNTNNPNVLVYFDPTGGQTAPYVYASSNDGRGYQAADLYVGSSDDLNDIYRTTTAANAVAQKPKSFQIISPGADGFYGAGGYFSATASNHGLTDRRDYDNVTNFHGGLLSE